MTSNNTGAAVIGSDWPNPLPEVTVHGPKRPMPTGLDWAAISPSAPEPADAPTPPARVPRTRRKAQDQQTAAHEEARARVEALESRPKVADTSTDRNGPELASPQVLPPVEEATTMDTPQQPTRSRGPLSAEVRAVADTLRRTADSPDMVVAACRAAVIAAADALRGAALRASEPSERAKPADTPARRTPRGGQRRVEETHPEILEKIRKLYVDDQLGVELIGTRLGLSPNTVSRILHRNGIDVRSQGVTESFAIARTGSRLAELGATAPQVRQWARDNGIEIAERGMLPTAVIDRFEAAQQ